ncbi:MAG: hypothetical protein KatS3mg119_1295 [Rhodothalassiaceae bacterium]|nr:MAG: hypothetical protein KatS3mg119_1295 [Rhodothalassiaceae bacterium]
MFVGPSIATRDRALRLSAKLVMITLLAAASFAAAASTSARSQTLNAGEVIALKCKCKPKLGAAEQIKIGMKWTWRF